MYGREVVLESGDIMGREVNNITLTGGHENILEGISDIHNANSKVVVGLDGSNHT